MEYFKYINNKSIVLESLKLLVEDNKLIEWGYQEYKLFSE